MVADNAKGVSSTSTSHLPAKWRRKSGLGYANTYPVVKLEPVEENLPAVDPHSEVSQHVKQEPLPEPTAPCSAVGMPVYSSPEIKILEVIDVDAELGEAEMDIESTRPNSPEPVAATKGWDPLRELDEFMHSLTVRLQQDAPIISVPSKPSSFTATKSTSQASPRHTLSAEKQLPSRNTIIRSEDVIDLTCFHDSYLLPTSLDLIMPRNDDGQVARDICEDSDPFVKASSAAEEFIPMANGDDASVVLSATPFTNPTRCSRIRGLCSSPSLAENAAYLDVLDDEPEAVLPKRSSVTVKKEPDPHIVLNEISKIETFEAALIPENDYREDSLDRLLIADLIQNAGKASTAVPNEQAADQKGHCLPTPSPPASGDSPIQVSQILEPDRDTADQMSSRSESVPLASLVPNHSVTDTPRSHARFPLATVEGCESEQVVPPRQSLPTPPPTASKRWKRKGKSSCDSRITITDTKLDRNLIYDSLPTPPLSSTDAASPPTPQSPLLSIRSSGLKRKTCDNEPMMINSVTLKNEWEPAPLLQVKPPRKRRKPKSAKWIPEISPEPFDPIPPIVLPREPPLPPPIVAKPEPIEPTLPPPLPVPPPTILKPLPTPSSSYSSLLTQSLPPEPARLSIKISRKRLKQPSASDRVVERLPVPMQPLRVVKEEEPDDLQYPMDTSSSWIPPSGLRRSQRVPKPRIKKEIEEFNLFVPQNPPRKSRVHSKAVLDGNGSSPTKTRRRKRKESADIKHVNVKDEAIDDGGNATNTPFVGEKIYIRIGADKLREIQPSSGHNA